MVSGRTALSFFIASQIGDAIKKSIIFPKILTRQSMGQRAYSYHDMSMTERDIDILRENIFCGRTHADTMDHCMPLTIVEYE